MAFKIWVALAVETFLLADDKDFTVCLPASCLLLPFEELTFLLAGSEEGAEVVGTLVIWLDVNESPPVLSECFHLLDDETDVSIGPLCDRE